MNGQSGQIELDFLGGWLETAFQPTDIRIPKDSLEERHLASKIGGWMETAVSQPTYSVNPLSKMNSLKQPTDIRIKPSSKWLETAASQQPTDIRI